MAAVVPRYGPMNKIKTATTTLICVGSISEYDVEDPLSTATMKKFLNKLEDEQRLFILENGVEWYIEHNLFIVSWDISVLFSHEHAVEYQLRWK